MPARGTLPDVATLLRELAETDPDTGKPVTRAEIARRYGVTRQAITIKLRGVTESAANNRAWPWDVQPRHKTKWLYRALTAYQITRTKERILNDNERGTLSQFLAQIEDLNKRNNADYVVDYDPTTAAGFFLRKRREGDREGSLLGVPGKMD